MISAYASCFCNLMALKRFDIKQGLPTNYTLWSYITRESIDASDHEDYRSFRDKSKMIKRSEDV